jgi:hypothetical protein
MVTEDVSLAETFDISTTAEMSSQLFTSDQSSVGTSSNLGSSITSAADPTTRYQSTAWTTMPLHRTIVWIGKLVKSNFNASIVKCV